MNNRYIFYLNSIFTLTFKNFNRFILKTVVLGFVIASVGLGLFGCTENDGKIGSGINNPGIEGVVVDTAIYPAVIDTFYGVQVNSGQSLNLFLGEYEGFKSKILLKFTSFSSMPDSFIINSAYIALRTGTIFGDSTAIYPDYQAHVHQLTDVVPSNNWFETNVTWDSVLAWDDESLYDFTISQSPDTDSVSFSIDTSIVYQWINADTSNPNMGLIFDYSGDVRFARQFMSSENADSSLKPQLTLYYVPFDTTEEGIWEAGEVDTFVSYAANDVFIAQDTVQLADNRLYLGRSIAYRSFLHLNLQDIFPVFGVSVNRAQLVVFADTLHPHYVGDLSTVTVKELANTIWMENPSEAEYTTYFGAFATLSGDSLTLTISSLVRDWIVNPQENNGFALRFSIESGSMTRLPLFPANYSDPAKRPYLKIIYSSGGE